MLSNLIEYYNRIPEQTKFTAKDWYRNAHRDIRLLALYYGVPFNITVAIVAALSPRLQWEHNLSEAARVLQGRKTGFSAIRRNVNKAYDILHTGNVNLLSGPKVINFYHNILDPQSTDHVTIDTWAAKLWGYKFDKSTGVRERHYNRIADDYKTAAKQLGYKPSEFQAILWTAAKRGEITP